MCLDIVCVFSLDNEWTDGSNEEEGGCCCCFHPHFLSSSFFDPSAYLPGKKKGRRIYHIKVRDMALYGV